MNRRSFFTKAGLLLSTAFAPSLFLPKVVSVSWKSTKPLITGFSVFNGADYWGEWKFIKYGCPDGGFNYDMAFQPSANNPISIESAFQQQQADDFLILGNTAEVQRINSLGSEAVRQHVKKVYESIPWVDGMTRFS